MTDRKAGWPLTHEFAEGLTQFAARLTDGALGLREVAMKALEVAIIAQEVTTVTHAKVAFSNERGYRPTFWELHAWAKETGRPQIAHFLYANRRNPTITGLFGSEPPVDPPEEP